MLLMQSLALIGLLLISCTRPFTVDNAEQTLPPERFWPLLNNDEIASLSPDQETLICATIAEHFRVPDSPRPGWPPSLVFVSVFRKNPPQGLLDSLKPDMLTFKRAATGRYGSYSGVHDPETAQKGTWFRILNIDIGSDIALVRAMNYMGPLAGQWWSFYFRRTEGEWVLINKEMTMVS
jgi:hypothetical protein